MPLASNVIATIVRTADGLAALPKPARKEWDRLQELQGKVRNLDLPAYSLPRAALTVLEADGDLMNDPDIQRAVISRAINEMRVGITTELDSQMDDFIDNHGPDILAALRKPFDAAAERIGRCLNTLGDVALEDAAAVVRKGGDAAQVWADAQTADQTIASIATAAKLMRTFPIDRRYQLLVIADIPPATFLEDQLSGARLRAWDAARAGYQLSLADAATFDERVAAIVAEQQQREGRAANAFTDEYRRTRGDGRVVVR